MTQTMRPTRIAELVAERLWRSRDMIGKPAFVEYGKIVDLTAVKWDMYGDEYDARIAIPDVSIELRCGRLAATVEMADHSTTIERYDAYRILRTWRAIQAGAILQHLDPLVDVKKVRNNPAGLGDRLFAAAGLFFGYRRDKWEGQHVEDVLDELLSGEIAEGRYERREGRRPRDMVDGKKTYNKIVWHQMRDGVSFHIGSDFTLDGDVDYLMVSHPEHGHVQIQGTRSIRAFKRRQSQMFASVLTGDAPRAIHLPQTGNARIARIARICRDAVTFEPDMRDGRGMLIRPLIETHLPDLLARHAAAARNAPTETMEDIDAELEKGVEIVRKAVEDAMQVSAHARMGQLKDQLRFLEARHPDASNEQI